VDLERLEASEDVELVRRLIQQHVEYTGSELGTRILLAWDQKAPMFVKIMPRDYKRVLQAIKKAEESGASVDEAVMASAHG